MLPFLARLLLDYFWRQKFGIRVFPYYVSKDSIREYAIDIVCGSYAVMSEQSLGRTVFGGAQAISKLRPDTDRNVVVECWSILSERLAVLFPGFFSKLDDDLFKRSDRAENNASQNMYFESMRQMRVERESLQSAYLSRLKGSYDEFWGGFPRNAKLAPKKTGEAVRQETENDFTLVGNDVLEESLAISGMVEKGNGFFRRDLYALNRRFSDLRGQEVDSDNNPVAPAAICAAFDAALGEINQPVAIKLLVYKIFDREILSLFGPIYQEMNVYLASQGVLPTITRTGRHGRKTGGAQDPQENAAENARLDSQESIQDAREQLAYLEAFRSLQDLLTEWKKQLGLPAYSAYGGGAAFDSSDVVNALNLLQQPAFLRYEENSDGNGEGLKRYILHRLRTADSDTRSLGMLDEDTIDMVQMIFDYILDDKNMLDSVKGLLARLQIPIVKTAILDKTFFAKRSHPARTLLNGLAQAGIGIDASDADSPVFRKIEHVVGRVLQEFDQNIALFESLHEEFKAFMEKEAQRSKVAEERARQVTQTKEKMWLAKKTVVSEISARLQGKETPASFQSFLYNDWKDVLILSHLRQDKAAGEWEDALAFLDRIIWTVTPPKDGMARQEIVRAIPPLLTKIREGLESVSLDPHQIEAVLKDLEKCHMACLLAGKSKTSAAPGDAPRTSKPAKIAIRDPEIAEAIVEFRENLPDVSAVDIEEVVVGDIGNVFQALGARGESREPIMADDFMEQAKSLNIGTWIEFKEESKTWRAKLSWKSPVTSVYVFVNRRGVKMGEMRANELALRMRQERARVVEEIDVPLMDRALTSLIESLKNPFWKPMQPPA